jgi:hypothetical protein
VQDSSGACQLLFETGERDKRSNPRIPRITRIHAATVPRPSAGRRRRCLAGRVSRPLDATRGQRDSGFFSAKTKREAGRRKREAESRRGSCSAAREFAEQRVIEGKSLVFHHERIRRCLLWRQLNRYVRAILALPPPSSCHPFPQENPRPVRCPLCCRKSPSQWRSLLR